MKQIVLLIMFSLVFKVNAQRSETENVKATIIEFFNAFHKQDTIALKVMVKDDIIMQSISVNKEGKTILQENDYNQFLKIIASIPKDQTFEEKLLDFSIQVDGKMANAWIPYEFWFNENFSHCGVNSFQLVKEHKIWKIIYLIDTRRRNDCRN